MIVVALIVIVIVVAGLGAIFVLQNDQGGRANNSDYTTFWQAEVGKFVVYTNIDDSLWNYNWSMRMTVLSINATHMMRDEAWLGSTGDVFQEVNWSAPINMTFGNGWDINYDMGWPVNVTETGLENLTTLWGDRTCIRYQGLWAGGPEDHLWVHNGVMVRFVGPGSSFESGTWVLTSTNIREVTHQW